MTSSTSLWLASFNSRTISPSARKRMRSAITAARASCVTITVVWPYVVDRVPQQLEDLAAGLRVEVAGRLVGEEDRRPRDERARERDALLLAAGELGRAMRAPVGEPGLLRAALRASAPRASRRRSTAAGRRSPRPSSIGSRLKNWKTKPMCSRRRRVSSGSSSVVISLPAIVDGAAGRLVEAGEDVHERRLAGARRAHDRDELPRLDVERDAAQARRPPSRPRRIGA